MMASKKKAPAKVGPVRNRVATHPLLMKGGAHAKTRKAERKAEKQALGREYPTPNH
jgi:hypothetical protein